MKYCYHCNHITPGTPLFCNSCGRSYGVKLCPRRHVNPRTAEACSQCGSRDLSTPQPRVPWWVPLVEFAVSLLPGVILTVFSVTTVALLINAITNRPDLLFALVMLSVALGILWWVWSELPQWFRTLVYRMLKRRSDGENRRRDS
jgi:hypothetical protein